MNNAHLLLITIAVLVNSLCLTAVAQARASTAMLWYAAAPRLGPPSLQVASTTNNPALYTNHETCWAAGQQRPADFQGALVHRQVPPATITKEAMAGYKIEEVRVSSPSSPNTEIGLGGILNTPFGAGPFPAVVLLADVGTPERPDGTYSLLRELADYLTRQGLAVLRLDDRGTGRSAAIPGATSEAELVGDAQSALNFLRTRTGIDPMRVGLLGHGEGANVALLVAAQAPAPAFVVALGAAGMNGQELLARQTSLVNQPGEPDTAQLAWTHKEAQTMTLARREAKKQLAAGAGPEQVQIRVGQEQLRLNIAARKRSDALFKRQLALLEIIRQTPDNAQAQAIVANMLKQIYPALSPTVAQTRAGQLTSAWYRSFLSFDPQAKLGKVSCPTLLLCGSADTQVPPTTNLPLLEKGLKANKHVNSQKLEGVNHDFQAPGNEQALATRTAPSLPSTDALEAVGEWVLQQVK